MRSRPRQRLSPATLAPTADLVYGPRFREKKETALGRSGALKPINWLNASTLVSVAILVGAELIGAAVAAGWAIGGLFALGPVLSHLLEGLLVLLAFVGLYYFLRAATGHEKLRGSGRLGSEADWDFFLGLLQRFQFAIIPRPPLKTSS